MWRWLLPVLSLYVYRNQPNGQSGSESSEESDRWHAVFVAITDHDLR